jgi:hypothetical protein
LPARYALITAALDGFDASATSVVLRGVFFGVAMTVFGLVIQRVREHDDPDTTTQPHTRSRAAAMKPLTSHESPTPNRPPRTARPLAWALVATLADVLLITFVGWDLIDSDSFPDGLGIPLLIAAVIALADPVARIISERRRPGASR